MSQPAEFEDLHKRIGVPPQGVPMTQPSRVLTIGPANGETFDTASLQRQRRFA
jgi:hypothetical protein